MDITYVKAVFGSLRKTRTKAVYRDDHDLILQLVGVKGLPVHFQAHFSNTEYGTAVVMMGSDGEVSIPNTLLATGLPVYCWILVEQGISGAVRYSIQIPVRQKARPDGTIPPEQADIISQAISALNDAGTSAQEAADSAAQNAEYIASVKSDLDDAIERVGVLEEAKETTLEAAGNAEAWAVGNRGGSAVPSTDPAYHNNAKYYAEQAEVSARASAESLEMISTEGVNLWNPTASYVQQNAAGDAKSGYTINMDGSVVCIRNFAAYGGLFLVDQSKQLEPGDYTFSGYAEFTDDGTTADRQLILRIGISGVSNATTYLYTQRVGGEKVEAGVLSGWFKGTFSISESQNFALMAIGYGGNHVNPTHPVTLSNIQIEKGVVITPYTSDYLTAKDVIARNEIADIDGRTKSLEAIPVDPADWELGSIYSESGNNYNNVTTLIRTKTKRSYNAGTVIKIARGYRLRIFQYDASNFISASDWIYGDKYTLPATNLYRFIFGPNPSSTADTSMLVNMTMGGKLYVDLDDVIDSIPKETSYSHKLSGRKIDLSVQMFNVESAGITLPPTSIAEGLSARQDFEIYNGVLFQLFSDNYIALVDIETSNIVAHYAISSGHGNSCQFSDEFYDPNDEYPLLYCFGYSNNLVYVNRVTNTGATLIRTYKLDTEGYRFSGGIDVRNNQLIAINYKADSSTDATNNSCFITVWDLNNVTADNADNTLVPEILQKTEIPFHPVIQGCAVFKDILYVASGYYPTHGYPVKLTGFDRNGNIVTEITDFPNSIKNSEGEGISFYKTGAEYECYFATYSMYKLKFS